jgi:hypothetical protein
MSPLKMAHHSDHKGRITARRVVSANSGCRPHVDLRKADWLNPIGSHSSGLIHSGARKTVEPETHLAEVGLKVRRDVKPAAVLPITNPIVLPGGRPSVAWIAVHVQQVSLLGLWLMSTSTD